MKVKTKWITPPPETSRLETVVVEFTPSEFQRLLTDLSVMKEWLVLLQAARENSPFES